jgi:hypothetical protein
MGKANLIYSFGQATLARRHQFQPNELGFLIEELSIWDWDWD